MLLFLDALCDDKLSSLIIEGSANKDELNEAWVLILSEYYELRGDSVDNMGQWTLTRDITKLQNHLNILDRCITYLSETYSETIAESVRRLGYSFRPSSIDPASYAPLLNIIVNKSKLKYVQLQQLIKQLQQQIAAVGEEKPKREYFETMLIHIEEMQGAVYDLEVLTVAKYVQLEKKYWQKIELLKQAHAKH